MAKTCSAWPRTFHIFKAPLAPMLTWSSWPLLLSALSALDGVHNCLLWETKLAAVYCGIMYPEFRPGSAAKNAGRPRWPLNILKVRRSDTLAHSWTARARRSIANANGWPWKLPPLTIKSSSGNTNGLSVTAFISASNTVLTPSNTSRDAPWTWGMHRNE